MRAFLPRALVAAAIAAAGMLAAGSAAAQVQQIPETSRNESQVNSLNRQMQNDQTVRGIQQQNQFETNQIRGQIRSTPAPVVVTPPPIAGPVR